MSTYRATALSQAPLLIQLGTDPSTIAWVTEFFVSGLGSSGSASHPVLSRPSVPGTGTPVGASPLDRGSASGSNYITSFSVNPSLPSVTSGSFNLPIRRRWTVPLSQAFVVLPSSYLLLYQNCTGGYQADGEITWEEK